MNPLEIHMHVARGSGREVGEISPLAAELTELANQARDAEEQKPAIVSATEQQVQIGFRAEQQGAAERRELAIEHVTQKFNAFVEYLAAHDANSTGGDTPMTAALEGAMVFYDEEAQEAYITGEDGSSIPELDFRGRNLTGEFPIPKELRLDVLRLGLNDLTGIKELPSCLRELNCMANGIKNLPELPFGLTALYCSDNKLRNLPELPAGLATLSCRYGELTSLPGLPSRLIDLDCDGNRLASLPELPDGLIELNCRDNLLATMPDLPTTLRKICCSGNHLSDLPTILPPNLSELDCSDNKISRRKKKGILKRLQSDQLHFRKVVL